MGTNASTSASQRIGTTLDQALDDPGVQRIARAMQLNLQDPGTLNRLMQMSQQLLERSQEVSVSQKAMLSRLLNPCLTSHARHAIRSYREVAALN